MNQYITHVAPHSHVLCMVLVEVIDLIISRISTHTPPYPPITTCDRHAVCEPSEQALALRLVSLARARSPPHLRTARKLYPAHS